MKPVHATVTRRLLLQAATGLLAGAVVPASAAAAADADPGSVAPPSQKPRDLTGQLARYMVEARDKPLPPEVTLAAKHRILDTLGAIVSGSRLKPGQMATRFIRAQGGVAEASVLATAIRTSAINAALANGMFAHADETDDFDPDTKAHPGCSVVPAAFAIAERDRRSGLETLRAVALGYDLCCRLLQALGADLVRATHRSAEGMSATFGSVGAAASLARLDERGMRHALSYAAQQVSGLWSWVGDEEHVEKSFDFAGMGARNGVTAALMAQMGLSGVPNVLDGEHNLLQALSSDPRPEAIIARLGERFVITETALKVYSVGYPIQSPLDAFLTLRRKHGLTLENVERIVVRLPADGAGIVNDRAMPDVNCQYAIAVALLDGDLSFEASHSYERMRDPQVLAAKGRIELVADKSLLDAAAPRSGLVEVTLRDGRTLSQFTRHAPGTKENPLSTEQVNAKARQLMTPVLGRERTEAVIRRVSALEGVADMRELRPLLTL
jgi:2-methylcitrate dehydratase PrpD